MAKRFHSKFHHISPHSVQYTVETGTVLTERLGPGGVAEFRQRVFHQMAGRVNFQVLDPLLLHSSPKYGHHHIPYNGHVC